MKKKDSFMDKDLYLPVAIVAAALIIAGSIIYVNNPNSSSLSASAEKAALAQQENKVSIALSAEDHVRGAKDASVTIVEFSDLECPFCKNFQLTLQQAVQDYDGKVNWVYKHFPIDSRHPKARAEAEAAECAADLGGNDKFWEFIDTVFKITPSNNGLDLTLLPEIATRIGLDKQSFQLCLDSGKFAEKVDQDYQQGLKAGVQGTPGSFVNGVLVGGAVPYEELRSVIEAELKKI